MKKKYKNTFNEDSTKIGKTDIFFNGQMKFLLQNLFKMLKFLTQFTLVNKFMQQELSFLIQTGLKRHGHEFNYKSNKIES